VVVVVVVDLCEGTSYFCRRFWTLQSGSFLRHGVDKLWWWLKAMEEEFTLEFEKLYSSSEADCPPYPTGNAPSADSSSNLHGATRDSSAI